jgi:excinuclease ABC subunit C
LSEPDNIEESEQTAGPVPRGVDVIAAFVKNLPGKPGVYRMYNENGDVLYVGKARNLKNRVTSYTRMGGHTNRIAAMICNTVSMEFMTTSTEAEALLLEANLIKKLKPRYNVILRDDKSFPYILIGREHRAAELTKHRGARSKKGKYFGPFASAGSVNRTINALQKAFLLRTCSDSVYDNRSRPCLLFQIKRCAGPCTGEISLGQYDELARAAEMFLAGKGADIKEQLARAMDEAAEKLDFERAAVYRDRISALAQILAGQGINPRTLSEADVFSVFQQGGQTCIQVFFFRAGQNWGNRAYFPRADKSVDEVGVLGSFISQFYDDRPVPGMVLLSHEIDEAELLAAALSIKAERKVRVFAPKRGEKRRLVEHALTNAREALGRKMANVQSQGTLLDGLQKLFDLPHRPRRIEVYDNSHIQGSHAVGGMIVSGPEGFIKAQYRKFNIKSDDIEAGDDYGMMREVLGRRFSRLQKEHEDDRGDDDSDGVHWPDVVLIDGGLGQLSVVKEVMSELGLEDVFVAGVAKGPDRDAGREHIYLPGKKPFMLESRDPVLYYIQRLRDEAHRFAIGSHRARRKKAIGSNPLDEVAGIGPGRKKALLRAFGSAREVARASRSDLEQVDGISQSMAKIVYEHFND